MSARTLGYPREMGWWIAGKLPELPHVNVIPRDPGGRRCAAADADYYEVHVCPVATPGPAELDVIEEAMRAWPGCFRVTRVGFEGEPETLFRESTMAYKIADPDWPTRAKASDVYTRPMVWALIRDEESAGSPS